MDNNTVLSNSGIYITNTNPTSQTLQNNGSNITPEFDINTSYINRVMQSESDVHYIYHVLLPGLDKSNLDIEQVKEKIFLTIIITLVNTVHVDSNNISASLFPQEPLKLIKLIENVNFKEEIIMNMSKGLLLVKIPKKYPIKRKKLKI